MAYKDVVREQVLEDMAGGGGEPAPASPPVGFPIRGIQDPLHDLPRDLEERTGTAEKKKKKTENF